MQSENGQSNSQVKSRKKPKEDQKRVLSQNVIEESEPSYINCYQWFTDYKPKESPIQSNHNFLNLLL